MSYAYVFLKDLAEHQSYERGTRHTIGYLIAAWRSLPHTRRVVMIEGAPAIRFDRIVQCQVQWTRKEKAK